MHPCSKGLNGLMVVVVVVALLVTLSRRLCWPLILLAAFSCMRYNFIVKLCITLAQFFIGPKACVRVISARRCGKKRKPTACAMQDKAR